MKTIIIIKNIKAVADIRSIRMWEASLHKNIVLKKMIPAAGTSTEGNRSFPNRKQHAITPASGSKDKAKLIKFISRYTIIAVKEDTIQPIETDR